MKQTAVEWFLDIIDNSGDLNKNEIDEIIAKAKEMEMEQIINAFKAGNLYNGWALNHEPEQYFNETYKNKTK